MKVGTLVNYVASVSGDVKGKIIGMGTDEYGMFYRIRVTVTGNQSYPKGMEFIAGPSEWLTAR